MHVFIARRGRPCWCKYDVLGVLGPAAGCGLGHSGKGSSWTSQRHATSFLQGCKGVASAVGAEVSVLGPSTRGAPQAARRTCTPQAPAPVHCPCAAPPPAPTHPTHLAAPRCAAAAARPPPRAACRTHRPRWSVRQGGWTGGAGKRSGPGAQPGGAGTSSGAMCIRLPTCKSR